VGEQVTRLSGVSTMRQNWTGREKMKRQSGPDTKHRIAGRAAPGGAIYARFFDRDEFVRQRYREIIAQRLRDLLTQPDGPADLTELREPDSH
jgi:hypothetical protein